MQFAASIPAHGHEGNAGRGRQQGKMTVPGANEQLVNKPGMRCDKKLRAGVIEETLLQVFTPIFECLAKKRQRITGLCQGPVEFPAVEQAVPGGSHAALSAYLLAAVMGSRRKTASVFRVRPASPEWCAPIVPRVNDRGSPPSSCPAGA